MKVIALEEHYLDPEVGRHFAEAGPETKVPALRDRLLDVGDLRVKEMDDAGIDLQILSHTAPATQRLDADTAPKVAREANDRLKATVDKSKGRFAGFAVLPTANPKAAADELERAVTKLGFKGAMIHGLTWIGNEKLFIDDKRFWPIFERAQALDVPIYLHPAVPHPAVIDAYYKDYVKEFPSILTAGWGFGVETATQGLRMVLSGVFEKYQNLKIILGHLGEGLPFLLWRIDMTFGRQGNRATPFRETFRKHFWLTTSGNFSTPALLCSAMEMGVDRMLFSVDYPYVANPPGVRWMEDVPFSTEDREKILSGNAKKLLKL
jgi:predicted TIM-barrel fold metal-dependent hydrolase